MFAQTANAGSVVLPSWALYLATLGSPVAAFLAVMAGHWVTRKSASEARRDRLQQEMMLNLRWATEKALSDDIATAQAGMAALEAFIAMIRANQHVQSELEVAVLAAEQQIAAHEWRCDPYLLSRLLSSGKRARTAPTTRLKEFQRPTTKVPADDQNNS